MPDVRTSSNAMAAPLAPPVADAPVARGRSVAARRLVGLAIALPAAAVLGLATWLTPAAKGLGTHEQLSLPACGWISLMDMPCPTCGMTTSFAHAADGNLLASFLTQPLGCVLALATAMGLLIGSFVAVTGSPVLSLLSRYFTARLGWLLGAGLIVSWVYKVMSHKGLF